MCLPSHAQTGTKRWVRGHFSSYLIILLALRVLSIRTSSCHHLPKVGEACTRLPGQHSPTYRSATKLNVFAMALGSSQRYFLAANNALTSLRGMTQCRSSSQVSFCGLAPSLSAAPPIPCPQPTPSGPDRLSVWKGQKEEKIKVFISLSQCCRAICWQPSPRSHHFC